MGNPVHRSSWGIFIMQILFALKVRKASKGGRGSGGGFRSETRVENKRDFKGDKKHVENSNSNHDLNGSLLA